MASLIASLGEKMESIPVSTGETDTREDLREIRDLLSRLNDQVKTVSDTLASLSEEV